MVSVKKNHSQSGFMSVESIANALFYLIMIAVVTMIAAKVMNTGKMATTVSALSLLRSNLQYVGTNAGNYNSVSTLSLPQLVPGLLKDLATPVAGKALLPTTETVTVGVSQIGDPDETGTTLTAVNSAIFRMQIDSVSPQDCRRIGYYGLGGGYGVMINAAVVTMVRSVSGIETNCGTTTAVNVVLTSR